MTEQYDLSLCAKPDCNLIHLQWHSKRLILCNRLAIYYLNTVSKGYQQANLDLKKKMKMVSMNFS